LLEFCVHFFLILNQRNLWSLKNFIVLKFSYNNSCCHTFCTNTMTYVLYKYFKSFWRMIGICYFYNPTIIGPTPQKLFFRELLGSALLVKSGPNHCYAVCIHSFFNIWVLLSIKTPKCCKILLCKYIIEIIERLSRENQTSKIVKKVRRGNFIFTISPYIYDKN